MHPRLALALPLLLIVGASCAVDEAPPPTHEPMLVDSQPIQGGYIDDFDTHVVGIVKLTQSAFGTCSGTLIAPNLVLTAQHCVAEINTGEQVICNQSNFFGPFAPEAFYVTTNSEFTQNALNYHTVAEVWLPPGGGGEVCGLDVAMLRLTDNVTPEDAIPATPRVDEPVIPGEEYYAVGFGQTSDNGPSGRRYRRDQLFVDCVGAAGCDVGFNSVADTEFLGDTGICSGDSGGPSMDLFNRVTGVVSRGVAGCDSPVYGHVAPHAQWIKDAGIYASDLGGYETPAWALGAPTHPAYNVPIGGACTTAEECLWGCHGAGYCTRPCTDLAPCPEGWLCNAEAVCELPPPPPVEEPPATGGDNGADGDGGSSSGCTYGPRPKDPTKPIPWKHLPVVLGLAALLRRRR